MEKEMEFFIYLIEHYANYKNTTTEMIINKLDELNLTNYIYNMYEIYHQEAIQNAFDDIDKLIKSKS